MTIIAPRSSITASAVRNTFSDAGTRRRPRVEGEVNQRRQTDAAECGDDGQQRVTEVGQLADVELAFEFEADEEEEDGHQRVVDPVFEAQAADVRVPQTRVTLAGRRVRDEERDG